MEFIVEQKKKNTSGTTASNASSPYGCHPKSLGQRRGFILPMKDTTLTKGEKYSPNIRVLEVLKEIIVFYLFLFVDEIYLF
jgi:hypothetical protein